MYGNSFLQPYYLKNLCAPHNILKIKWVWKFLPPQKIQFQQLSFTDGPVNWALGILFNFMILEVMNIIIHFQNTFYPKNISTFIITHGSIFDTQSSCNHLVMDTRGLWQNAENRVHQIFKQQLDKSGIFWNNCCTSLSYCSMEP